MTRDCTIEFSFLWQLSFMYASQKHFMHLNYVNYLGNKDLKKRNTSMPQDIHFFVICINNQISFTVTFNHAKIGCTTKDFMSKALS